MLIINYFFFFKVSRLHVCFDFERESLETPKRTQRRPDGTCLENPSDYTDGRTVRTFRRRRQLHPPNHLLLPPRLSVWSFL